MSKVYCNNCKHRYSWDDWESLCNHPEYTSKVHKPTHAYTHRPKCETHNKSNNCSNYEPNLVHKVMLKIKELINEIQRKRSSTN